VIAAVLWFCLFCAAVCFSVGTARLIGWMIRRPVTRVDSAYRAARLVAISKAEVSGG